MRTCFLCGRNGTEDPLDKHHIFGGPYRRASERYGATVYLCHDRCHENGPKAAHRCSETREELSRWAQRKIMKEQGWTVEQFRLVFGRSWIGEEEVEPEITEVVAVAPSFVVLADELPF